MGLLDNNMVLTAPKTGLEGTDFKLLASTKKFDVFRWVNKDTRTALCVTYRNVFAWAGSNKVYLVKGKITDTPTEIEVNSTNFPNLRGTPSIVRIIACPCTFVYASGTYGNVGSITADQVRVCVIFNNGQIYHNYPSCFNDHDFYSKSYATWSPKVELDTMFTKFDESVVWDLPNRKHPVKTTTGDDATLIATGVYYHNPSLPDASYELHPGIGVANGYGNTTGFGATNSVNPISSGADIGTRARFWHTNPDSASANSFAYMGGYVTDNLFTMVGTYQSNTGSNPCRICVFGTQDGGRNWYCMYEFAGRDMLHYGEQYSSPQHTGLSIAQSGSVGSGVYAVKKRTLIVPAATDKEPSHKFEYGAAINVTGISGDENGITVTTASAHGYYNGDCIVVNFQSGQSANGRDFDWMVNPDTTADSGGNGILFKVSNVTTDTFKLTMYIWNPDNNLPVRHIHAINRCKDGVSVSTGENYPSAGWILYDSIISADAFGGYNVASLTQNSFLRLNSARGCYHRSLGTIIRQEADGTYCYISMDEAGITTADVPLAEGRTQVLKHNSTGVYKVKIDGIDSLADNGVILYQGKETAFGFQEIEGVFVFTGQFGDLALSFDNGVSWIECTMPPENSGQDLAHFGGVTYDRKFSINNVLIQLK